jgi:hypothetical protein
VPEFGDGFFPFRNCSLQFGPEREVGGEWRKMYDKELYNLYFFLSVRVIK